MMIILTIDLPLRKREDRTPEQQITSTNNKKKMKKHIWMGGILASLMMACSPASQQGESEGRIDVVSAFENLTELKVSHLGKNIRYVPLETTDSSLIGASCRVNLLDNKIMVTYGMRGESHCYLFDRETGRFVREVGHKGEDPRGYSEPKAYVHPVTENIYFHRMPDKLIKYSLEGEFLGEVKMPNGLPSGFYPLLTEDGMLVYEGEAFNAQHQSRLYFLDEVKGKTEEVALSNVLSSEELKVEEIHSLSVMKGGVDYYGLLGNSGAIVVSHKDETQKLYAFNYPAVWSMDGEFRFHEELGDTIYRVKGQALEPYRYFDMGERHLPKAERGKKEGNEDKLTITYVMETPDLIYFQCAKNLYGEFTLYDGIYRQSDGSVMMNLTKEGFTDDLTGFAPFRPTGRTADGRFVGILTIEDIQEWLEEHPEVKLEGALAPLDGLADDANPVVVIVEP